MPLPYIKLEEIKKLISANKLPAEICIHTEKMPTCPLSLVPIRQPVIASNGELYDKSALEFALKNPKFYSGELTRFENGKQYKYVQLAVDDSLQSLLFPTKSISENKHIVLVGRSRLSEDTTVLFIEKYNKHSNPFISGGSGSIDCYQLKPRSTSSREIVIEHQPYTGIAYSALTLEALYRSYNIKPIEAMGRCFYITNDKLKTLQDAICADIKAVKENKLYYYQRSGKPTVSLWCLLWWSTPTNSSKWARDLLYKQGILKSEHLQYDKSYPSAITNRPGWREFLLGATPDRVLPHPKDKEDSERATRSPGV